MKINGIPLEYLFDWVLVSAERTDLKYDLWLDAKGKDRVIKDGKPLVKFIQRDKSEVTVLLSNHPCLLAGVVEDNRLFKTALNFIAKNADVLLLHWNHVVDDVTIINYCTDVGREKKSKKEALQEMVSRGSVQLGGLPKSLQKLVK